MSSLLQFEGTVSEKGVGLIAYLKSNKTYLENISEGNPHGALEMIEGTNLPVLYQFFRKVTSTWGHWAVFRYNGESHVPDLSVPLSLDVLPKDAKRIPDQAALRYWLDNGLKEAPKYGYGYEREERREVLGIDLPEYRIGDTGFPALYEYPMEYVKQWMLPEKDEFGIDTWYVLPPCSNRIGDQAALRVWIEATDGRQS